MRGKEEKPTCCQLNKMTGKREAQLYQYLRLLKGATTATTTERQQQRRPRGGRRSKLIPTSIPTLLLIPVFPSNCPKISLLLVSPKLVSSHLVAAWIGLALLGSTRSSSLFGSICRWYDVIYAELAPKVQTDLASLQVNNDYRLVCFGERNLS